MAEISVIVPTYNGVRYIEQALQSVFAQTRGPREIIVVDDASTDGTVECVGKIAKCAPLPVRLIRLPHNSGGPAQPINVGIRATLSPLIAVLDQDDLFTPTKLERQAAILEQHPDLSFAFSLCGSFDWPGQPGHERQLPHIIDALLTTGRAESGHVILDQRLVFRLLFMYGNFVIGYPAFLFWRKLWESKGGVDERCRIASDYDLLCWLCQCGPVALTPEFLFLRRSHGANLSEREHVWKDIPDEIAVRRRCFARQEWLLEDRDVASRVRAQVIEMATWLRVQRRDPSDFHLLWRWRGRDPEFASDFLARLIGYLSWHCDEGNYGHALRLMWQAARIGGWRAHTWSAMRELVSRGLRKIVRRSYLGLRRSQEQQSLNGQTR